ncbi:neurocan core protein-like, partial [Clarias magur]
MEVMNPTAATSPLGTTSSFGSMPVLGSQQERALQSLRGYATPSSNGILSTQTSEPVEIKQEAMEIMRIPVFGDNHENYSGEGKDHIEEGYSLPKVSTSQSSPQRGISEEESDTDGSGGNDLFISSSHQTKQGTPETSEEQNVLIQTTVQWQLLGLPTGRPSHSASVPRHTMAPEEARGEVLYIHNPTEISGNTPFPKVPLVEKESSTHAASVSEIQTPYMATTSELTLKASSATDQTPSTNTDTMTPTHSSQILTTDAITDGDTVSTTDPVIPVTWLPVVQDETEEPQTHAFTEVTSVRIETTRDTVQPTTPYVKEASEQAETESQTQPAPTTGNTSGDNTSKPTVDYENDSSASS